MGYNEEGEARWFLTDLEWSDDPEQLGIVGTFQHVSVDKDGGMRLLGREHKRLVVPFERYGKQEVW